MQRHLVRLIYPCAIILALAVTVTADKAWAYHSSQRSGEEVAIKVCFRCHGTGTHGTPGINDRAAWIPRDTHGIDVLVRSAINGQGAMADRADSEIRGAANYMFHQGVTVVK